MSLYSTSKTLKQFPYSLPGAEAIYVWGDANLFYHFPYIFKGWQIRRHSWLEKNSKLRVTKKYSTLLETRSDLENWVSSCWIYWHSNIVDATQNNSILIPRSWHLRNLPMSFGQQDMTRLIILQAKDLILR